MPGNDPLDYLEWQALVVLYRNRDRTSSPVHYVGSKTTITSLVKRHPPLVAWVGKPSENQVHITTEGITLTKPGHSGLKAVPQPG